MILFSSSVRGVVVPSSFRVPLMPAGQRAELIDGRMYMMAPPARRHQKILGALYRKVADYIDKKGRSCEVDTAEYTFSETVKAGTYDDLEIDFSSINI